MKRSVLPTWKKLDGATASSVRIAMPYPFNAFRSLLGIAGDVSAPTFDELYSGKWEHPTCSG